MRKPAAKCRALNQAAPIDGATVDATRRKVLGIAMAGAAIAMGGAASSVYAQSAPKIRVGYWPIAAGLPFYVAIEKGFFKEAGLDVEALKLRKVDGKSSAIKLPSDAPRRMSQSQSH